MSGLLEEDPVATTLTESDVIKMISSLSNWGRWGKDDELGTINLITPEKRKRAAALGRGGAEGTLARVGRGGDARRPRGRRAGAAGPRRGGRHSADPDRLLCAAARGGTAPSAEGRLARGARRVHALAP